MRCYHRIKLNIHKVVFMLIGIFISIYFAAYMVNLWGVTENNVEKKYVLDAVPSLNDDVKKENNEYDILNNDVTINFYVTNADNYNYLLINFLSDNINEKAKLYFYDDMGHILEEKEIELSGSTELLKISQDGFSYIKVNFKNMSNISFKIQKMQFRSELAFSNWVLFAKYVCVCFIVYISLSIGLSKFFRYKNIVFKYYVLSDVLIYIYDMLKRILFKEIKYISKYYYIVTCTIVTTLLLVFYKMYSISYDVQYIELIIYITIGIFLITKLLSKENNIRVKWNNPLAMSWIILSVLMIISEIFTDQTKGMIGYFNLGVLGIYFYITGKIEKREKVLNYLRTAILITFIPCIIKCLFFYNESQGILRYAGLYSNSNQFAGYVIVVFAVLISDLDYYVELKQIKSGLVFNNVLLGFASCFLWLTQTRTTLLAMLLIIFLEIAKIYIMRKKYSEKLKNIIIIIFMLVIIPITWEVSIWSINNISLKNSNQKIVVKQIDNVSIPVYAAEDSNRIVKTLKNSSSLGQFSNNRFDFWMTYIRNMNLVGHKDFLYMESISSASPSHNAIIGMMYKYGIFTGIPYIIMLFFSFWYAIKYFINNSYKKKNAMLPLNIVIAFIMCALLDTMDERPFWKMLWLVYYLIVGFLMNMENEEDADECLNINNYNEVYYLGCNKLEKYTITLGLILLIVLHVGKFIYIGVNWWESRISKNSIYFKKISNETVQNVPLWLTSIYDSNQFISEEETMPEELQGYNPDYFMYNGINYVYYQDIDSNQVALAASKDDNEWKIYKDPILKLGKTGAFDDTAIIKSDVVYVAPYYYMIYIGENSELKRQIGIAVSNDGIIWTKKNVRGTFKEEYVEDISAEYDVEAGIIKLEYIKGSLDVVKADINVSQNRDMFNFDTEADWTTSLVSSEEVLSGSYGIEGDAGSKNVWMQSEASVDLYYNDDASKLILNGYMPLDIYMQKNINAVTLNVKINGEEVYKKIFNSSEVFQIEIPIDTLERQGDSMHIELSTDYDFIPKKWGISEDERNLSYIINSIKQE